MDQGRKVCVTRESHLSLSQETLCFSVKISLRNRFAVKKSVNVLLQFSQYRGIVIIAFVNYTYATGAVLRDVNHATQIVHSLWT